MNILVTGGLGFIGSNFLHYMMKKYSHYNFINLDIMSYAGNIENVKDLASLPNYHYIKGDICDEELVNSIVSGEKNPFSTIDVIVNFAAESHVDRSIKSPIDFVKTNMIGTEVLLEAARQYGVKKYIQISTDEVYGTVREGAFTEKTPLAPNSPYSASKAGADMLVRSYYKTYGLQAVITRCSNNYGAFQYPEKLIPLMVIRALEDKKLPIYGDGQNIRDWIHVLDHCSAVDLVIHYGRAGEVYNIGSNNEQKNIDVARMILSYVQKPDSLIEYVNDRPGHDRHYSIDSTKIQKELGWKPAYTFERGLKEAVDWYRNNKKWWESLD
ncbi:dTDP-glucose 4,6-dehydratase [bacterium LRH843]|nr:dTDP-glucose 4,6-dehydratase [bacterium LRH843]